MLLRLSIASSHFGWSLPSPPVPRYHTNNALRLHESASLALGTGDGLGFGRGATAVFRFVLFFKWFGSTRASDLPLFLCLRDWSNFST